MRVRHRLSLAMLAGCACILAVGCSRGFYRRQADRQAEYLVGQKGGYLDHGHVYATPDSRMFDPFATDRPPMPPDDPQSHRLMHCVDGKRGWKHWHRNGDAPTVEPAGWVACLPTDEAGVVTLSLDQAIGAARVNSREYQQNLETLYISALDVSFERFRFDHQLFAGNRTFQDFRGSDAGARSQLSEENFGTIRRLSATGGELIFGLANSLVWDFWGTDSDVFSSTLDFSIVQPLLRFGGRARVMEQLTQTERNLLANVRQMQQYRQGFFVDVATGRNSGPGPSLGNGVGQAGLGLIAGFPSGRSGAASAGGYMGLLQQQQRIRNQESNIAALRDSLAQLEAAFAANRIKTRLQVDQARQALLNAQSSLLVSRGAYDSRVDAFKIELGLPPDLEVNIKDTLLNRFVLIDPEMTQLQNELADILVSIRKGRDNPTDDLIDQSVEHIDSLSEVVSQQIDSALTDLDSLQSDLPKRIGRLERVQQKVETLNADVDARVFEQQRLEDRVAFLRRRLPAIAESINLINQQRKELDQEGPGTLNEAPSGNQESAEVQGPEDPLKQKWRRLNDNAASLSDLLLELSLLHAEVRLQGIMLLPLEISPQDAFASARSNRLDWMNARANLVDVWRRIEFVANELKSDLDLVLDGQLGTDPDNIVRFDSDNSRVRFGLQFDTPTTRLVERNRYCETLINYQRARRDYMLFEDRVMQSLRNTLRIAGLSEINLEVRRAAVEVAIAQVDNARLRLNPPLRPGQTNTTSPTAARDLVSALTDLLDAQNDFLDVWVNYQVIRILLDFEMGTMQLSPQGVWIDPGPIESFGQTGTNAGPHNEPAELPLRVPQRVHIEIIDDDRMPELVPPGEQLPENVVESAQPILVQ